VRVRVDEVEARRGPPMAEQPRLDVLGLQRLPEERVVEQVDLPHREIVRGPPVHVDEAELDRGHEAAFFRNAMSDSRLIEVTSASQPVAMRIPASTSLGQCTPA